MWTRWNKVMGGVARTLAVSGTMFVAHAASVHAQGAESRAHADAYVQLDFVNAPLRDVAAYVAEVTGINIVLVPSTLEDRSITIIAPRPVPLGDVPSLLIAALNASGLTIEDRGTLWLIVPLR